MYSDKQNINILTATMRACGITTAVVCPGSRNAPVVHDFCCAGMRCVPVTDERSAGFYALGLALATRLPVAVCVTSGSALLNLAPAVAEAYYRQLPLLIVSADRPEGDIDQLHGQTLPQPGALGSFAPCYELPVPSSPELLQLCRRRASEAMMELTRHHGKPVHINVPLDEPLFRFTTPRLPEVTPVRVFSPRTSPSPALMRSIIAGAERPLVVIAQHTDISLTALSAKFAVLHESLSTGEGRGYVDEVLDSGIEPPDLVIYFGGTLVSKRARKFLAASPGSRLVLVSDDGRPHDISGNLTTVLDCDAAATAKALISAANLLSPEAKSYRKAWRKAVVDAHAAIDSSPLQYGMELAVKMFEEHAASVDCHVHYANSSAVRMANRHARGLRHVNRGVNGIEGSLSTAAGFSLATSLPTYCAIGDLSFFYDCNALWCSKLGGNLRILLLNNSRGSIFDTLPGLQDSPAFPALVAGPHHANAAGICAAYDIRYRCADSPQSLSEGLDLLFTTPSSRPLLLEVNLPHPIPNS